MIRKFAILALATSGLLFAAACWLWAAPRPDAAWFLERRGNLSAIEVEPEQLEAGGFVSQNVRLGADTGLHVELRVLRPVGGTGPLPLVVLMGGHRTGRDAVRLLGSPRGIVVAALNYPYDGPERPRGVWQSLKVVRPARRALRDMPAAVLLATEWLVQQAWVDPARVEVAGVSLGVPFAAVAGAIEPRFRRVWLIQGGADIEALLTHNLSRRLDNEAVRRVAGRVLHRLARASMLEPEYWAPRIAPRPVVIVAAREDQRLPVEFVERLDAAIHGPKEMIWIEGDHVDRRQEAVREIMEIVLVRIEADAAP